MHAVGVCLLLASGVAGGMTCMLAERRHLEELRQAVCLTAFFSAELRTRPAELSWLLVQAKQRDGGALAAGLENCLAELESRADRPFAQTWAAAFSDGLSLSGEERSLWLEVGQVLGRYDAPTQCRMLDRLEQGLDRALQTRQAQKTDRMRLQLLVGGCIGVLLTAVMG